MLCCAVLAILMYLKYIPVAALTSDLAGVFCQLSRMAMQSSVRLASIPPREFLRQLLSEPEASGLSRQAPDNQKAVSLCHNIRLC